MKKKGTIVIGQIGAGRIGKLHATNLSHEIDGVRLKTIMDVQTAGLEELASKLGIQKVTSDYKEILEDDEIDAVVIASSTDTHAKFIQESAMAGKDIFCEKPIDYDAVRIRETLRIVEDAGVKLFIGFNRRFDHNFARARAAITAGEAGTIHVLRITSRDPAPPPIEYVKVSGGLFYDMTIHDWDMARFLAGEEVVEVFARGDVLIDEKIGEAGDIDTAVAILKFKSGALGIIENSRQAVYGYDQRIEAFGSKGCVTVDNDFPNTVKIFSSEDTRSDKMHYFFLERYMGSYITEMKAFVDSIKNDSPVPVGGIDGLNAVLIADAAMMSLKENKPVRLEEQPT